MLKLFALLLCGTSIGAFVFVRLGLPALSVDGSPPWLPSVRRDSKAAEGLLLHVRYAKEIKMRQPKVLFIGDSILAYWPVTGAVSWNKNFAPLISLDVAIGGDITQSLLWRLENGAVDGISPKVVVLMIGSNNLIVDSAADTVRGVSAILDKLHAKLPKSRILLLSILPRDPGKIKIPLRMKIDEANALLKKIVSPGVTFVDVANCVLDKAGNIRKEILPDGIHPSSLGYDCLAPSVVKAIWNVHS